MGANVHNGWQSRGAPGVTDFMKKSAMVLRNVGHGANDIYWFILPSLLPLILVQFDMKYETAGGLLTAFLGVIAVFSFIQGKLSDRFHRQIILGTGFLVASISLILSSFMNRLGFFVACIVIAGMGVSSYHPAIYAYIDETTQSRQGKEYGMFEFWGSTAIFFMFLLHGLLLKNMNWRNIIFISSIPGIVVGSLYFTYRLLPRFTGVHPKKTILDVPDARAHRCSSSFSFFL